LSMGRAITEKEVLRAKAQLKTSLVMNLESASSRADQVARQYLAFGEVPKLAQLVKRIEAVEAENVRELAQDIFSEKRPSLSAVGQLSTLSSYQDIAARFALKP
jgi:predicted Zn-dependent peptidase